MAPSEPRPRIRPDSSDRRSSIGRRKVLAGLALPTPCLENTACSTRARDQTGDMKLVSREDRRWFVAAIVFVLLGIALLLLPLENIPVLGDASMAGRIIGVVGVGIAIRSIVLIVLARRDARASARRDT